ncbi:MAG TPA: hypothetical protein VFP93_04395, partial [Gammaproteobacteria bacterium]|nr:hypothetical protein [Gammaproteobacteria bacterium]
PDKRMCIMMNPELRRNIWLEFTTHRLIAAPVVLGCILYIGYLTGGMPYLKKISLQLFILLSFVWGTRTCSDGICSEINAHTWDWQRMSSLSPMKMSIGKLLGSTSFTWYCSLLVFMAYIACSTVLNGTPVLTSALVLFMGALFTQSLALVFSLNVLHYERHEKILSFKYFVAAVFIGGNLTYYAYKSLNLTFLVPWFHYNFSVNYFAPISLTFFFLWSLIALYRNLRIELQYKNIPWVWGAFTVFCVVYFSGFLYQPNLHIVPPGKWFKTLNFGSLFFAFAVAMFLTYLSFLMEEIHLLRYKKLIISWSKGKISFLENLPRWVVSFIIMLFIGIWIMLKPNDTAFRIDLFVMALTLLSIRDILLAHFFNFGINRKRTMLTILFYFAVLYILIPTLLELMHLKPVIAFFIPAIEDYPQYSIMGPLFQVSIFGYLVMLRAKRLNQN